jgi:hypothetical protein
VLVLIGQSARIDGLRWESETRLRIGRLGSDLEVVLQDQSVSRHHAEVTATPQGWVIRDLGSANGTLVNGAMISNREQALRPDDVVQCGTLLLRVAIRGAAGPVPDTPTHVLAPPAEQPGSRRIRTSGAFLRVQAASKQTWEDALRRVALAPEARPEQGKHLLTLLRTGHHLTQVGSLEGLLQAVLADAVGALDAQRGAIVLIDEATGGLKVRAVASPRKQAADDRSYSHTLAERCFNQGESLLCEDVSGDSALTSATSVLRGKMASIVCALVRSPRKRLGVLHLDRGPFQAPFNEADFYLADALAANVAVGIESAQLVQQQQDDFIRTITVLARTVELRDQYTGDHTNRVTWYSLTLAEQLGMSGPELHHIRVGTPLHDIGKIGIDDAILRKPDKLTREEFEEMKTHTTKGVAILECIPALGPVLPIVRSHHERWDGTGYPDRLARDQIARMARVVAVADAFDAMTSDRPYRKAMPAEAAFAELERGSGTHFDPDCVTAFLAVRPRVEAALAGGGFRS